MNAVISVICIYRIGWNTNAVVDYALAVCSVRARDAALEGRARSARRVADEAGVRDPVVVEAGRAVAARCAEAVSLVGAGEAGSASVADLALRGAAQA